MPDKSHGLMNSQLQLKWKTTTPLPVHDIVSHAVNAESLQQGILHGSFDEVSITYYPRLEHGRRSNGRVDTLGTQQLYPTIRLTPSVKPQLVQPTR